MFDVNFTLLGLGFVAIFGACWAGYRTLFRKRPPPNLSPNLIVFRTPNDLTTAQITLMCVPMLLGLLVPPSQNEDVRAQIHTLDALLVWSAVWMMLCLGLPVVLMALHLGYSPGPQELRLDKERQTYELRFGTFLKPQFRTGSWQDIKGVHVRRVRGKGTMGFGVYIAWCSGLTGGPYLHFFRHRDLAEWSAEKIATGLGLQVVSRVPEGVAGTA